MADFVEIVDIEYHNRL